MKNWATTTLLLLLLAVSGAPGAAGGDDVDASTFSIAILPSHDAAIDSWEATCEAQARWLLEKRESEHVVLALRAGGITGGGLPDEWEAAVGHCAQLQEAGVPTLLVPGAEDIEREGPWRDVGAFLEAFGGPTAAEEGAAVGRPALDAAGGSALRFEAAGGRYLVIGLALDPDKDALCRASERIQQHPDHRVILVTPRYLGADGEWVAGDVAADGSVATPGAMVFNELIRRHSSIGLVLCTSEAGDVTVLRERATGAKADPDALEDPVLEVALAEGTSAAQPRLLRFDTAAGRLRLGAEAEAEGLPLGLGRLVQYSYDRRSDLFHDRAVNTTVRGQQRRAALAGDALGNFVVAWEDDGLRGRGDYEIRLRGFHPDGCERFAELTVNSEPWGAQTAPSVATAPDGSTVVVWEDGRRQGDFDVYAAGFDANGRRIFGDVRVNRDVVGLQRRPSVAIFSDGSFVVAWEDDQDRDNRWDVLVAGFDGYGRRSFAPVRVHAETRGQQLRPQVGTWSRWSSGSFVVVWEDDPESDDAALVFASGFDPRGRPMFQDVRVHEAEVGSFRRPAICVDEAGSFVVAWEAAGEDEGSWDVYVSAFDRHGERRFADRRVSEAAGRNERPDVALRSKGDFTVVWEHVAADGLDFDVLGRGFDGEGEPRYEARALPAASRGAQRTPRVDVAEDGSFLTTWMDDVDGNDVFEIRVNRTRNTEPGS